MRPLLMVLATASIASAQTAAPRDSERPAKAEPQVISSRYADIELTPYDAPRGSTVALRATVRPRPGIHIYAPGQRGYYPVSVTFPAGSGITSTRLDLPAAEPYVFAPTGEKFLVYRALFTMTQHASLAPAARTTARGATRLAGTLHYQACDEHVCYRPQAIQVEWTRRTGVKP